MVGTREFLPVLEKRHFSLILHWKKGKPMIKRKIYKEIARFYQETNKALLITDARQVGKTFSK